MFGQDFRSCLFSVFLFCFSSFFIYQQNGLWMTFAFILPTPFVISRKCQCFVTKLKKFTNKGVALVSKFQSPALFSVERVLELKCCCFFFSPDYTLAVFPLSLPGLDRASSELPRANGQGLLACRIPLKVPSWPRMGHEHEQIPLLISHVIQGYQLTSTF